MWKFLSKSFWSGTFWPPQAGQAVVTLPDGIQATRLTHESAAARLTDASAMYRLTDASAEYRLVIEEE